MVVVVAMPATATGDVCVQILWLEGGGGEFGLRKGNPKIELRGCGSRGILYVCTLSLLHPAHMGKSEKSHRGVLRNPML